MVRKLRRLAFPLALALGGVAMAGGCVAISKRALSRMSAEEVRTKKRAELAVHRKQQIARLHAYTEAGLFPIHSAATLARVHIFKDEAGRRCAIANLVHLDGQTALVDKMAKERNDVVVADEASGPLHDWVLTSGLTNEEVRRIQGEGFDGAFDTSLAPEFIWAAERERIREHLQTVEMELVAATDRSLEVALSEQEGRAVAMP
jgi:hypothetical protein